MDWPVAAIIITAIISLLTVIVRYLQARNRSGNPGNPGNSSTFVSEKVCNAQMKAQETSIRGVHHRIGELETNLGGRISALETSINNLIARM